jgi:predicted Zn finger-like uncharacterized protein
MPTLKTQCPECDTKLRIEVDGEGEEVECPKCGHEFTAALGDDEPAQTTKSKDKEAKKAKKGSKRRDEDDEEDEKPVKAAKKTKASKRREEEEDDEDEAPKKKRKKGDDQADSSKTKIIVAGAIAGLLLLGGAGGVIYAVTKKKKPDPPTEVVQQQQPPLVPPGPNPPGPNPPGPNPPGPNPPGGPNTGPNPPLKPPGGQDTNPNTGPKKDKDPEDEDLATFLPPPPKIRISGSAVPEGKPVVRPPSIPPLAPDEDPFNRAKEFKPDGALPPLPALPPRKDRPILTLEAGGHTDIIGKVFFTPKGDRVITIAQDKAVRIWDPATNETIKTIRFPAGPGKEGSLQAAAVARTGKQLAVAGYPLANTAKSKVPIYIISPETGALIKTLNVASGPVGCMHFSNDGKWLGVGCDDATIQMVNMTEGTAFPAPQVPGAAPVQEVKFNPDTKNAKKLATLDTDSLVQIWTFTSQPQRKLLDIVSKGQPSTLAWSNDGRTLAIGTKRGEIMLGTAEGKLIKVLPPLLYDGKPVSINQLQFLPNDNDIAVCGHVGAKGWGGIVSERTGTARVEFKLHSNVVFAMDVSPDGSKVATTGGNQHETYVWSTTDGAVVNRFVGTGKGVWSIGWSKDGKSLAWGTINRRNENGDGKLENTFRLDELGVGDPPDASKYVQELTSDESVHIKRLTTTTWAMGTPGRDLVALRLPDREPIFSATVLPKGNAVVVAGVESLKLVSPATREVRLTYVGHTGNVLCVTPSPDGRLFATGSSDQTIRIWRRDQEDPILSIFVSGRDWIAWTPQGYYACSGQGERLIAWQVGGGAGKAPVIHPAERFRSSMYQPAIVKYVAPTGDLPVALAMAQKYDKALVKTTNVADVLPPEVALDGFGESEVKVDKDTLTVKATAKGKHAITTMRLLVDGRPFQGAAGVKKFDSQPGVEVIATWEVPLPPGTHTVAVIADSPVSKGMSKIGVAVRPGEPPKPNLYVLTMGVGDYTKPIPKLDYCANDALLLAAAFREKSKGVFNKIEVRTLTDKQATKQGILQGLDWLKSKMTPQDVGIISFSGHGTKDAFGQFYLCPFDMDPKDEDCATGLSGKLFKDRLDEMPGRLVAILDACHSGSVAEKGPPTADTLVRDLTAEDSGVIVMCASAGREYATESKLTKAGFYTFGLVEGLSGLADVDGDGVIYIHELDLYATARVRQLSGGRQNPTLGRPQSVRPFPIAKLDGPLPKP